MLNSLIITLATASIAAASVRCPIKPYDARPGYQLACVRGDQQGVYENQLIKDITVDGSTYSATVPFECVRETSDGAKWLGYNLNGRLCWITEGNVQGEDTAQCFTQLKPCHPGWYTS